MREGHGGQGNCFRIIIITEKALFQVVTVGLLLLSISVCRLRERGRMSKSVYVSVVQYLELLRYVLRCAIERQL